MTGEYSQTVSEVISLKPFQSRGSIRISPILFILYKILSPYKAGGEGEKEGQKRELFCLLVPFPKYLQHMGLGCVQTGSLDFNLCPPD